MAWAVDIGLIAYGDLKNGNTVAGLPPAGDFLATFVVFGGLAAIGSASPEAQTFSAVAGWAFVLAAMLKLLPAGVGSAAKKTAAATAQSTKGVTTV